MNHPSIAPSTRALDQQGATTGGPADRANHTPIGIHQTGSASTSLFPARHQRCTFCLDITFAHLFSLSLRS